MKQKQTKHNLKKPVLIVSGILLILLTSALCFVSKYLLDYAISPAGGGGNRQVEGSPDNSSEEDGPDAADMDWAASTPSASAEITSRDGYLLKAVTYQQEAAAAKEKWAIVIHGYRSQKEHAVKYAKAYYDHGYNVLVPDLRAHGESEGDYIGMGWPDRLDMLDWISFIAKTAPDASIVLHGVSMGGATVMMTSGEELPSNVTALIEDCGYTSVWDIFSSELNKRFGLPDFPLMHIANAMSRATAGYPWDTASSLDQLKKCTTPILFIHGSEDDFVPTEMVYKNYDAAVRCKKELLVVEGAAHGKAVVLDPELYWNTVFTFIDASAAE